MAKRTSNGHAKKIEPLPTPQGYKRLRLYPPVWRAQAGDRIRGHVLSVEPIVRRNGVDANAVLVLTTEPCPVLRYSARGLGIDDSDPPGKLAPLSNPEESVAVDVTHLGSIGRLMHFGELPEIAQTIDLHAVDDGHGGILYECFIAIVPAKRVDVDPRVKAAIEQARRAGAATA